MTQFRTDDHDVLDSVEPAVLWRSSAAFGALDEPLTAAGDRLIGVAQGTIFMLNAYDGTAVDTSDEVAAQHFPYTLQSMGGGLAHPVSAGGNLFFADGASVQALRLADGAPLPDWKAPEVAQVTSINAVDQRIVISSIDHAGGTTISAFAAIDGAPIFGPISTSTRSSGPVALGLGALFFVADGQAHAINIDYGDDRWSGRTQPATVAAFNLALRPLITADSVVFAAGNLLALDARTAALRWSVSPSSTAAQWMSAVIDDRFATVVAADSSGEIVGISAADGKKLWSCQLIGQRSPVITADTVYTTNYAGTQLTVLDLRDGSVIATYALPDAAADGSTPLVVDGTVFHTLGDGSVVARPFAEQSAARFDGRTAHIEVKPDAHQFDFGLADFTIETWCRTTVGGELISSYPTVADGSGHGLRLNMTPDGQIRIAVVGSSPDSVQAARTVATHATDGTWHHIAAVRTDGTFSMFLDGRASTLKTPDNPVAPLPVDGENVLTLGAYRATDTDPPSAHFDGLLREVRVWDRALDPATIGANQWVELIGTEPHLKGLWRLDEVQDTAHPTPPMNEVTRHRAAATFVAACSHPTALTMDKSAFPYLIHEGQPTWPYFGTWGARGEKPILAEPAVADMTVAFMTNNALYGVGKDDGKRLWSVDAGRGASAPVTDGNRFLALTVEESIIAIDAATGGTTQLTSFADFQVNSGPLCPPASDELWIAAIEPAGLLAIADRRKPAATRFIQTATHAPTALGLSDGMAVVAAPDGVSVIPAAGPTDAPIKRLPGTTFCFAGSWLVCAGSGQFARYTVDGSTKLAAGPAANSPTGLAAWPDSDLIVATHADGTVTGSSLVNLTTRWTSTLPGGAAVGAPVFDDAGRIVCTTADGTVAVLSPDHGTLLGLYHEPQSVNTAAIIDTGTAFYGCAEPTDPNADCDGALHSLVLGQTLALRLGVDPIGTPQPDRTAHAVVDVDLATGALHLMNPHESCVEAWINVPPQSSGAAAGGILGICPTTASDAFDVALWIDPDGSMHYVARQLDVSGWSGIHATAPTDACDGRWHHIAVSRTKDDRVAMYFDGLPLAAVTVVPTTDTPQTTVPGIKAYLGAVAGPDLTAAMPWSGMLAEVRVWDTYLTATEISTRMHVKLRGDEPDLIAFWNFDHGAVHDGARQGHDGVLVDTNTDPTYQNAHPTWWLVDLPFTLPSYPEIRTAAKISADDGPDGITYDLRISVLAADGSILPSQPIELWYVIHDPSEPPTITVSHGITGQTQSVTGVTSTAGDPPLTLTSGPDGSLTLKVVSQGAHGPSLDCRAPFMPANERFHINCLVENQLLSKPTPPTLTAQTKLIQDYHYTTGSKIDQTRDRTTHRVVLLATTADHTPMAGVPVTLWAASDVDLEIAGQAYAVNAQNTYTSPTSAHGEVVIDIAATDLKTTTLYARAGFMARNDRILIRPDDDAQTQLANLQSPLMTTPTLVNWHDGATAADNQTMLSDDYLTHADAAADAVRKVMCAVKPPPTASTPTAPTAFALRASAAPPSFMDTRQPLATARIDEATVLRTLTGINRRMPVDVDGLRTALGPHLGFVITCNGTPSSFSYRLLSTEEDVLAARGTPTPPPHLLGHWYDDLWHGIEDVADDIYHGVVSVAVTIADSVQVAITTLVDGVEKIVHTVVHSVEAAIDAVVSFFKQLLVALELLILFLRALFDWNGIRGAQRLFKRMLHSVGDIISEKTLLDDVKTTVSSAFASFDKAIGIDASGLTGSASDTVAEAANQHTPAAISTAGGVVAKTAFHKLQDHGDASTITGYSAAASVATGSVLTGLEDFTEGLVDVAGDLLQMHLSDAMVAMVNLWEKLEDDLVIGTENWLLAAIDCVAQSFEGVLQAVDTPMEIGFLGELYKWIFKEDLTLLNLVCLVIGLPLHIVYFVVTRGTRFSSAADGWLQSPTSTEFDAAVVVEDTAMRPLRLAAQPGDDTTGMEIVYAVMKSFHILAVVGTDATFSRTEKSKLRAVLKICRGAFGVFTAAWAYQYTLSTYRRRLEDAGLPDQDTDAKVRMILGLASGVIADGFTLVSGAAGTFSTSSGGVQAPIELPVIGGDENGPPDVREAWGQAPEVQPASSLKSGMADYAELVVLLGNAVLTVVVIVRQGRALKDSPEYQAAKNPSADLRVAADLLFARSISYSAPKLVGWMFTQTPAGDLLENPDTLLAVTGVRAAAQGAGLICHAIAGFKYLT
ncbi:LamG-like jellyroll fold domain-containing protein [Rhodococcus sp. IEGM 1379]|uniref:LamG-like jellyroll fold domain-containing protein n=1 Tax=Rhodococcus sp. IEGM 1379 TaxID=3047086 RepID=UPI0024B6A125|nr:LamG-like jellyroll fold domain-containing protein [Rhodococcus sp. IEGM 1379]MDI9917644.1 PQQ-binding-like beta-propeller repeat protein [Rhodococcus sp. IEGM 1379]